MAEVLQQHDTFADEYDRLQQRLAGQPAWLTAMRDQAMRRFADLGIPTTKHEEWRFTSLQPLTRTRFTAARPFTGKLAAADLAPHLFESAAAQLVFVDGHYRADLSSASRLPAGVSVMPLSTAVSHQAEKLRPYLGQYASYSKDAFTALNTAMLEDGAFIHVPARTVVEAPIHLLLLATDAGAGTMSHPRNIIVAESQAHVDVIEHYVALGEATYFSNAVTEVVAGANARVHHYFIESESHQAYNISTLRVQQERSSRFESHTVLLGGAIVRNNIHVELQGPGCESLVNGLYLPTGTQHMDNHMRVVHAQPHCDSRQFYKGVLDGKSSGVFSGRIVVHEGAQKTDAKQTNRNLLLTDDAHVDTKPQLEIYADDVKCTHGATIGQLDEDQLFYLRARGVPRDAARSLLVYAFAHEALERMTLAPVRARLEQMLFARMPGAADLEAMLL